MRPAHFPLSMRGQRAPSGAGIAAGAPRLALDRHANRGQLRERRERYRKAQDDGRQQKTPALSRARGFGVWPGGNLLSRAECTLSSAQTRFTVLFGMGRRGSRLLWPPDKRRMKK